MSGNLHNANHLAHAVQHAPPLKEKKSPLVAFVLGFLFGPFGVGIYTRSWMDFFVCLVAVLCITVGTGGCAALFAWCLAGAYGALRVHFSNEKLAHRTGVH